MSFGQSSRRPNSVLLELRTMVFRHYSKAGAGRTPTLIDAPYAGRSAMIADYHEGQSLIMPE